MVMRSGHARQQGHFLTSHCDTNELLIHWLDICFVLVLSGGLLTEPLLGGEVSTILNGVKQLKHPWIQIAQSLCHEYNETEC